MLKIREIFEDDDDIFKYLQRRALLKQYLSAKSQLLSGSFSSRDFKKRQPKSDGVWSFRINRKYRAWGYFRGDDFIVSDINDHQ